MIDGLVLDLQILHWIQANIACPALDLIVPAITHLGTHGALWLLVAVLLMAQKKYRKWGIFMLVFVGAAWVLGEFVIKTLVARPRPFIEDPSLALIVLPPHGYSFPSGHTITALCAATLLAFSPLKKPTKVGLVVIAVLIAMSRVYLNVHNPSDVAFGALMGVGFGCIGGVFTKRFTLDLPRLLKSRPTGVPAKSRAALPTEWGEALDHDMVLQEHPQPQFARESFVMLNGWWQFKVVHDDEAATQWRQSEPPSEFDEEILVPFSPEAPLSGLSRKIEPSELVWYRRSFEAPDLDGDRRCLLHFEAVDYACTVYVNGVKAGSHTGAYLPFCFDITEALVEGANELCVCAYDPNDSGTQLRGKQRLEHGGIWYTAQSGIWQPVWLELVSRVHIEELALKTDIEAGRLDVELRPSEAGQLLVIEVFDNEGLSVSRAAVRVTHDRIGRISTSLHVSKPHLWSPENPYLYTVQLEYGDDRVRSYCAFRSVAIGPDAQGIARFLLNGKPYFVEGVLDQGYWPDGLMTAPSDEALVHDIEAMKELGFNMLRKHIKVESRRWYYHCDRLGMLVWQDMVSGGGRPRDWQTSYKPSLFRRSWAGMKDTSPKAYAKLSSNDESYRMEWRESCVETCELLRSHPCVATWVLFNEGWGQFDSAKACDLVSEADGSRPVDAASGWFDQGCGDYRSVHNYFRDLEVYKDRSRQGRAFMLSEFGGLSCRLEEHSSEEGSYGYEDCKDLAAWLEKLTAILEEARALEKDGCAGYVLTQLSDIEEETNGLLTYDRRVNKVRGISAE